MRRARGGRGPLLAWTSAIALLGGCAGGGPSLVPTPGAATTPRATDVAVTGTPSEEPGAPSPERDPGTTRTDDQGVEQVWVPGGTFTMGSPEGSATGPDWAQPGYASEHPEHEVRISAGFWIDRTEVTAGAFADFVDAGGYEDESLWSDGGWSWRQGKTAVTLPDDCVEGGLEPDEPQVCVTFWEAQAYAAWRGGRLPTEAEWEFAARGPASNVYPWGNAFDAELANLDRATGPVAVGSYPGGASWVGAEDLAGNAMEWVNDWWSPVYYQQGIRDDPTGPERGFAKVEKGGWWGPPLGTGAFISRSSYRHFEDPPFYSDHHIGFRIVTPD